MDKRKNEGSEFFVLQSHRHYHLIILATAFLIFLFVPLFILTPVQAKQVFNNGREGQVVLDILALIAMFSMFFIAIYWMFTWLKRREMAASLIRFLFCWVALSGFLFPLTTNNGMLELVGSPLHVINFFIVLILSFNLAIVWGSKHVKTVSVFLIAFLVVAILPTIPRAFSQFEKQEGGAPTIHLSDQENLLLVGMDGVPGHILNDIFAQDPAAASTFKDFTFYENAVATSPATEASLMGVIYGNHDFTAWEEPYPINWKDLPFNDPDNFNFYTLDKFNIYNDVGTKLSAGRYGAIQQRNELFEMYKFVVVRLFSTPGINVMVYLDVMFADRGGKFYWTTDGYDTITDSLSTGSERPTVLFSHFAFTHWPASIDANCVSHKTDNEWLFEHTNKRGVIEGAQCVVLKYRELLDKLKALGAYDNTTIVFYSDHGKPVLYYDEPPHNLRINWHLDYGFDRYQPFIMIKPAGAQQSDMVIDDKNVILDDLAQTICYQLQPSNACEDLPGINILDDQDKAPENFYIHVVKDRESRWFVQDQKAVSLPRDKPLLEAMQESDEIILTEQVRP